MNTKNADAATAKAAQHTSVPWTYDDTWALIKGPKDEEIAALHAAELPGGRRVHRHTAYCNAAFIVRACNAHGELLEALQNTCSIVDSFLNGPGEDADFMDEVLIKARAALANAKGDA